jgi:hypothetical protein
MRRWAGDRTNSLVEAMSFLKQCSGDSQRHGSGRHANSDNTEKLWQRASIRKVPGNGPLQSPGSLPRPLCGVVRKPCEIGRRGWGSPSRRLRATEGRKALSRAVLTAAPCDSPNLY